MNKETADFLQYLLRERGVEEGDFTSLTYARAAPLVLKALADALGIIEEEET